MEINVERIIRNVVVEVLHNQPFFGHILCQLPRVFTDSVPTMAVGKKSENDTLITLYINPDYVKSIYESNPVDNAFYHFVEVMKHELHHVIFQHLFLKFPNKRAFDIACELAANSYLDRSRMVDKGVFPEDYKMEPRLGVEEYYEQLNKQMQEQKQKKKGQNGKGSSGNGGGSVGNSDDDNDDNDDNEENQNGSNGNDDQQSGNQGKSGKSGKQSGDGDMIDSHDLWEALKDDKISETLMKDIIKKAKEVSVKSNRWGDVPSEIQSQVDKMLEIEEEKIPWQKVLRDFVASSSETDLNYTNKHISKRYGTRPGTVKENRLHLAVGIDTSGSIDDKAINLFFNELHWIAKDEADITVFEADAEIQREYPFRLFDGAVQGRGGTDLEPVIKECDSRKFDALIYFTDAFAPKIENRYRIPTVFVVSESNSWHVKKDDLPYPTVFTFYVKENGDVTFE